MKAIDMNDIQEMEIVNEAPRKVRVGDRWLLVRQLTLHEVAYISRDIARLWNGHQERMVEILKLMSMKESSLMEQFQTELVFAIRIDTVRKDLIKLLNKIYPSVGTHWFFRKSYLERHLTPNGLIQLAVGLYQYNVAMVKKNILAAVQTMDTVSSPAWMSSSKKPLDGN